MIPEHIRPKVNIYIVIYVFCVYISLYCSKLYIYTSLNDIFSCPVACNNNIVPKSPNRKDVDLVKEVYIYTCYIEYVIVYYIQHI